MDGTNYNVRMIFSEAKNIKEKLCQVVFRIGLNTINSS